MTKSLRVLLSLLTLIVFSGYAMAECDLPATPIIPDGNVASQDELVAAQKAMKMYQANLAEYRDCLTTEQQALNPDAEDTEAESSAIGLKFDGSIDAESAIAEEFNVAVRAYKARQAPAVEATE